jgi:hypothetical protein
MSASNSEFFPRLAFGYCLFYIRFILKGEIIKFMLPKAENSLQYFIQKLCKLAGNFCADFLIFLWMTVELSASELNNMICFGHTHEVMIYLKIHLSYPFNQTFLSALLTIQMKSMSNGWILFPLICTVLILIHYNSS